MSGPTLTRTAATVQISSRPSRNGPAWALGTRGLTAPEALDASAGHVPIP